MARQCMRPGCDREVAARLTFDPVGCADWLDSPVGGQEPVQQVCSIHAATLTVPLGWTVTDRRFEAPPTPTQVTPAEESEAPLAPVAVAVEPEVSEPDAVEPAVVVRRRRGDRRRQGLLDRALRYSGPQQSVLTQPPGVPVADDAPGGDEDEVASDADATPQSPSDPLS